MDEKVKKSLTDLIDETLMELEELKKSRFAASEIDLKGPGEGIAGKPSNGDLHAKSEAEKADKDDEDDKDEDKDDDKDMDKGEGKNRESDPDGGHHHAPAGDGDKHGQGPSRSPKDHKHVGNGKNNEADPNGGSHRDDYEGAAKSDMDKKEDKKDKKKDKDDKEGDKDGMDKTGYPKEIGLARKSEEEMNTLMKSMIDDRVKPLEDKLGTILDLVNKIADQPVAPKGITSKAIPLFKSNDDGVEKMTKSEISSKLFELKKSGTKVESLDVTRAELGQDLDFITKKYNLSK